MQESDTTLSKVKKGVIQERVEYVWSKRAEIVVKKLVKGVAKW